MRLRLFFRDDTQCPSGTQYYTCASSGFKGCCSVDACDYTGGCPDTSTTGAAATGTSSTPPTTTRTATATRQATSTKTTSRATSSTSSTPPSSSSLSSSSFSSSSSSTTSAPPAAASTTGSSGNGTPGGSSSSGISKAAIGGIVAAGVLAFVLLAALVLWKMHRRNQQQKQQAPLGGEQQQPPPVPPFPQPSPSSANPQGSPLPDEKGGIFQKDGLLSDGSSNNIAEMHGTPASTNASLFGEAPAGDVEASIARWGLHGARLAAKRRSQQHGSIHSQSDVADFGGSYLGPGSELRAQGMQRIAELYGQRTSAVAELETPLPTPWPTPLSTPQIGSYSPSLSVTSSQAARSTLVSSWRNSSRTMGSSSDAIAEESNSVMPTPEIASTPQMPGVPQMPDPQSLTRQGSTAERPRATLDMSQNERVRGLHVTSWGSYQP